MTIIYSYDWASGRVISHDTMTSATTTCVEFIAKIKRLGLAFQYDRRAGVYAVGKPYGPANTLLDVWETFPTLAQADEAIDIWAAETGGPDAPLAA
jgi:hypothetical protein